MPLLWAQNNFPQNGASNPTTDHYAFYNATLHISPKETLDSATLIIKKGRIISVGQHLEIPQDAIAVDLSGKHLYPSFIDLYTNYGLPEPPVLTNKEKIQYSSAQKGAYGWNQALTPEYEAVKEFSIDEKKAHSYRQNGFGTVLSHRQNGIVRGSGLVTTLDNTAEHLTLLKPRASSHFSFRKGNSKQVYPTSQMGVIALIRQMYLDQEWYRIKGKNEAVNLSLAAWDNLADLPQIFETSNALEVLRAHQIAQEFNQRYIIKTNGDSYQRIKEIRQTQSPLIVPVHFPLPYEVEDEMIAEYISYPALKAWEWAPANLAQLEKHHVTFALTSDGLKNPKDFLPNIRKAIQYGLTTESALASLTTIPAQLLHLDHLVGQLKENYLANFIITDKDIWAKDAKILENWIQGQAFHIADPTPSIPSGKYHLITGTDTAQLMIKPNRKQIEVIQTDSIQSKGEISLELNRVHLIYNSEKNKFTRLTGQLNAKGFQGSMVLPNGEIIPFIAARIDVSTSSKPNVSTTIDSLPSLSPMIYPFESYGFEELPQAQTYLIRNATVWTNEASGKLEQTDVLVENGKIKKIGSIEPLSSAIEIDGTGKHLTPGIIDEHSHIAIQKGVNEGSQASTAEVRIGDVINANDINIYRQLSGGVTTSQLLHGSANPIGGQSALIKLRWGKSPEEMKFKGAAPFIKFALGENVKQSNWGDHQTVRFPQTRMGVEQVFVDYFTQAQAYIDQKNSGKLFRRDLELEALSEILQGQRFITCHSYVQSEINMLLHVADQFGFKVNTFTHILEGYKVADKMKAHGAAGSTFSDWWAYKYEVVDAIPYNAALMHQVGVVTGINSDDAELARRLNVEAGKMIKYGKISEEDALKMVTLNPAKMLHIEDRVGSIKVGKDADLVLWDGHPLSTFSKAEITMIDGTIYFDRQRHNQETEKLKTEKAQLIQKMILEKKAGGKTQQPTIIIPKEYHCDTVETESH